MADDYIHRKNQTARQAPKWLWFIIGGMAIAALCVIFIARTPYMPKPTSVSPTASAGGSGEAARLEPVRDLMSVAQAQDPRQLVGREVEFTRANVVKKVDNRAFWIGPSPDQAVLVLALEVDNNSQVATGSNIRVGQTVSVVGDIRENPGFETVEKQWKSPHDVWQWLQNKNIYVYATRVTIEREPGQPAIPTQSQTSGPSPSSGQIKGSVAR